MNTIVITKLDRTSPLLDRLAMKFVNDGLTPESIITALKAVDYQVNFTQHGRCSVDAITVANIARGIILARTTATVKPAKSKPAKKSTEA